MNLSGMNRFGSSQLAGSRLMAHVLTNTRVFAGTWYPPIIQSLDDSRAMKAPPGWSLRVSFIMASIYGRFGRYTGPSIDTAIVLISRDMLK
ncbi:hypothetical protein G4B88_020705 [Cannabis sativa]|uniref:Uncharacterized protein n=1 Tax=Cannabis sativa TaxID=3483 RepID=A0A7J6HN23_CANSA|nr:hypothetical protein G4B88_020705 [Cannabis sativa]